MRLSRNRGQSAGRSLLTGERKGRAARRNAGNCQGLGSLHPSMILIRNGLINRPLRMSSNALPEIPARSLPHPWRQNLRQILTLTIVNKPGLVNTLRFEPQLFLRRPLSDGQQVDSSSLPSLALFYQRPSRRSPLRCSELVPFLICL